MSKGAFTAAQRAVIWHRAQGCCEVCGYRLPEVGWNAHHRRGRGMGGTSLVQSVADGLAVCGSGTTGCHGWIEDHFTWAWERGYKVRRNGLLPPHLWPVLHARHGWVLLGHDGSVEPAVLTEEMREIYNPDAEEVAPTW